MKPAIQRRPVQLRHLYDHGAWATTVTGLLCGLVGLSALGYSLVTIARSTDWYRAAQVTTAAPVTRWRVTIWANGKPGKTWTTDDRPWPKPDGRLEFDVDGRLVVVQGSATVEEFSTLPAPER